jgi:hypothetical protein
MIAMVNDEPIRASVAAHVDLLRRGTKSTDVVAAK